MPITKIEKGMNGTHFRVNDKHWVTFDSRRRRFACDCVGNAVYLKLCKHIKEVLLSPEVPIEYLEALP